MAETTDDRRQLQIPEDEGGRATLSGEHRHARERAARQEADASGRRYRFLAKAIPQIVWTATPSGRLDSFNPRWTEYTGLAIRQRRNRDWLRSLHADDRPRWREDWKRAVNSGLSPTIDIRLRRSDGAYRWHLARALPVLDRSGQAIKWLGTCTDIDDQKRAEGMLGFLAEVSNVLASSLDYETTLAAVAGLAVPSVADWCLVDMLEPDGSTRRLAVAHADPAKVKLGWEIARRYPPAMGGPGVANRVLRTGRTEFSAEADDASLAATASATPGHAPRLWLHLLGQRRAPGPGSNARCDHVLDGRVWPPLLRGRPAAGRRPRPPRRDGR